MRQLIQKACDIVGGQTALARVLTDIARRPIGQQRVNNWLNRGDAVPVDLMAPIEKATEGKVARKAFRPDDWDVVWPELVQSDKDQKALQGDPDSQAAQDHPN